MKYNRESDVEKRLVDAVKREGGIAIKLAGTNRKGMPDRLLLFPEGRVMFIEVKRDKGRLSELQKIWIDRLRALGFQADVIYGEEDVEKTIRGVRYE